MNVTPLLKICAAIGTLVFIGVLSKSFSTPPTLQGIGFDFLPIAGAIVFLWWKTKGIGMTNAFREGKLNLLFLLLAGYLFSWAVIFAGILIVFWGMSV